MKPPRSRAVQLEARWADALRQAPFWFLPRVALLVPVHGRELFVVEHHQMARREHGESVAEVLALLDLVEAQVRV